jgi:hypothetical protein
VGRGVGLGVGLGLGVLFLLLVSSAVARTEAMRRARTGAHLGQVLCALSFGFTRAS